MKKLLCAIVLFVLIVFAFSSAFAAMRDAEMETIHQTFKNHTIDDLVYLRKCINIELEYRGYAVPESETQTKQKEVPVPVGTYTVGEDIPAGKYTVLYDGSFLASVTVKSSAGKTVTIDSISTGERIGKLELKDGQTVIVDYDPVVFTTYQGLGF